MLCVPLSCSSMSLFFFFNDTATTEIYTLSLHDALPIFDAPAARQGRRLARRAARGRAQGAHRRSEEHTSELQSLRHLVCRLLLEKKKNINPKIGKHITLHTRTAHQSHSIRTSQLE